MWLFVWLNRRSLEVAISVVKKGELEVAISVVKKGQFRSGYLCD